MNSWMKQWSAWHAMLLLMAGFVDVLNGGMSTLAAGMITFSILLVMAWPQFRRLRPFGGLANRVTFLRLLIVMGVLLARNELQPLVAGSALLLFVALDGLDGYLARKYNQATGFGALFDMETDAFYCAAMSLYIYQQIPAFWPILIPGFLHFVFVLLNYLPRLRDKDPPKVPGAKIAAVMFMLSLVAPFLSPLEVGQWVLLAGGVVVCISFGVEFIYMIAALNSGKG